ANTGNHYLDVELRGNGSNKQGVGAKVLIKQNGLLQLGYVSTTKGFESSSLQHVHFGINNPELIDTLQVVWPNGKTQTLFNVKTDRVLTLSYKPDEEPWFSMLPSRNPSGNMFADVTDTVNIAYKHRENSFNDFNIQPLIPHKVSTQGPKLAVADIDNDGLDDFYVCGARNQAGKLFIQKKDGQFSSINDKVFAIDSAGEEVNAVFFDADGDSDQDLYVVSGGNESQNEIHNSDRLYINDGKGNFAKSNGLPELKGNKSVAIAADVDKDGDLDLFVGGRVEAGRYGATPQSYLLLNDGKGKFSIAAEEMAPGLQAAGMITDAAWTDLDKDGWMDLVIVGEWMPVTIFKNQKGKLVNETVSYGLEHTTGLWTTLHVADIDNDGADDLLAGNWGVNSKLHANVKFPLRLYVDDFDKNGSLDQVLALENGGKYYPFLGKDELDNQLSAVVKKKYLVYASFAGQTVEEVFVDKLGHAKLYIAEILSSIALVNDKKGGFVIAKLPAVAQWSPIFSFLTADFNRDGTTDILSAGNFYGVLPYEGRYDANCGTILLNENTKGFRALNTLETGFAVEGEVRDIKLIRTIEGKRIIAVARNNESLKFFTMPGK
ncbi:MAG: FG-GAP-like repeat-containing protein, partial [Chitinophagaceae bacterium]